jgi:adenylylsulfate kinase
VQAAQGKVVWFTGLSGAGKSTLCTAVQQALEQRGRPVRVLDGDDLRRGLCADLDFSDADRAENVRRAAHVAQLLATGGTTVLVALITPLEAMRDTVRQLVPDRAEVFVDAPLPVCEARDPKGLYRRARAGELPHFTGSSSPWEPPAHPDLVCSTHLESVETSVSKVLALLAAAPAPQPLTRDTGRRRTLAVDFDGVIADYSGWQGEASLGAPRADVCAALGTLRAEGWKIVVHTTRGAQAVEPYLRRNSIAFDEINRNSDYSNAGPKPVATVYWDDRALAYSGDAARDLPRIRAFRTWCDRG